MASAEHREAQHTTGMGLPSDDRPPGATNGTYYAEQALTPQEQMQYSNGGATHRRHGSGDANAALAPPPQERVGRTSESAHEHSTMDRPPKGSRRPSAQNKEQRVCGKCGKHLTGQFVRALGDTYHLECFTCHVSPRGLLKVLTLRF